MAVELHPKYEHFIKHTGRYSVITGGRGSGKSFSLALIILLLTYTKGQRILYTRLTMTSARKSIIPELQEKIDLLGRSSDFRITKDEIINITTNSSILFMGIRSSSGDNTARLKSLKGISTLLVEEAEELIDEAIFNKIDDSIRVAGIQNRVILMLNPATKTHWIYKRFYEEKGVRDGHTGIVNDVCYIHSTYLDNLENLDKDKVRQWENSKIDRPEYYKHSVLGGWLEKSEGVVFTDWEFGDYPSNVDSFFGADWGYSIDPSALVEVHIDKRERKIYLKEHFYENESKLNKISRAFKNAAGTNLIVADYGGGGDRIVDELKDLGLNIKRCIKGAGSVKEGIMLMKDYKLIVDPKSFNLAAELNNYSWKERGEHPIDKWNHLIDAARYIITDRLKEGDGVYRFY